MILSNLPALLMAGSRDYSKLVAPITITESESLNPSISVKIWLIVSREYEGSLALRFPATESISSINIILGDYYNFTK
jgi:hypothetical protein